jgi:phosphatidylglycerol---prolipoprotein diacylglyceryl transferase
MYATLYHAVKDLFGLEIPFLKVVMTFGFFVAMAFLAAHWVMTLELKRKEKEGILSKVSRTIAPQNPFSVYFSSAIMGFLIGWKILYLFLNFSELSDDPQGFLISSQGSVPLGILVAAVFIALKFFELKKKPLEKEAKEVLVRPYEMMGNLTFIAAIAGFAGAKIFHHLENLQEFLQDPIGALLSPFSGLTFFGGLICGGGAVLWYAAKYKVNWRIMLDVGAPTMMLAYGIGRMGCHFSGDGDWGIENLNPKPSFLSWLPDWAWAYHYPNNVLGIVLENPVYPTPMYEVFMALGLFLIIWYLRKKSWNAGKLFSIYLVFAGIERFLIEKIRVNPDYHFLGMSFTQAEMISFTFVILGIGSWIYFSKNPLKNNINTIDPDSVTESTQGN